jgi:WD40 repeat protein
MCARRHGPDARLWDAATAKQIAGLRGHEGGVLSAGFSPDGARIVTASDDKTARLWDAATAKQIAVLRDHEGAVLSATFSPDGAYIVTASLDNTARLWDAATAKEIAVLRGHERHVHSAAFSPDGARIVTASERGQAAEPPRAHLFNEVLRRHGCEMRVPEARGFVLVMRCV